MRRAFKIIVPEFFLTNNSFLLILWRPVAAIRLASLKTTMLFLGFKMGKNVFVEIKHLLLMICYQNQIVTHHVEATINGNVAQEWKIASLRNQVIYHFSRTLLLMLEFLSILWWEGKINCGPKWTFCQESSDNNWETWTDFQQLATSMVCVGSKMSSNF